MKIVLGTFKDNGDELAAFLEPRVGAKLQVSGGELTVDDDSIKKTVRARHVKTYVKRFLWKKGERDNYRVLVEGKELRLIELEPSEAEEEEMKRQEEKDKERAKREEEEAPETEPAPAKEEGPPAVEEAVKEEEPAPAPEEEKAPPPAKETKRKSKKSAEKPQPSASPST
jgi:outer membrane biosynthesis protein TonB